MLGDVYKPNIFAKAASLLASAMQKGKEQVSTYPVQVYITTEIYETLRPRYQDLYHSPIQLGTTVVYQRFSEDAQRCFVVSPIGAEGSEIRKRADFVFQSYIKPACETTPFRPVRGEMMRGNYITSELMEALQSDPIVIVYLGPPKLGWNPNVMIELGGRIIIGAPYIVIKDGTSDGKPYDLPFNLKSNQVVDIPEQEQEDNLEGRVMKIRTIRERIVASVQEEKQWDYLYPGATVDIKIGGDPSESKFTDASKELETLFELKGIVGRPAPFIIEHLLERMPPFQRQPFTEEQNDLIARLVVPTFGVRNIRATVPIVFQEHQQYKGRAFLPIIVRYNYNKLTSVLRLRMLYIDVTSATKLDEKEGCYICALTGNGKIDLSGSTNS